MIEHRMFERYTIDEEVVVMHWSSNMKCKLIDISANGVCFLLDKKYGNEIQNFQYGTELRFKLQADIEKHLKDEDYLVKVYTCFLIHLNKLDNGYKLGAVTSYDIFSRLKHCIN